MNKERGMISVLQALLLGPLPLALAWAGDWYVDVNFPLCPGGIGTQARPFCQIMDAVASAGDGDTIHIAPGTYFENVVIEKPCAWCEKDLNLIGTGGQQVTILDGGAGYGPVIRVEGVSLSLTGLTLTNGDSDHGGGIRAIDSIVVLKSSTVSGNVVQQGGRGCSGAGINSFGGSLTLIDSAVTDNYASFYCGPAGIYASRASLTLTNSIVSNNQGGGIVMYGNLESTFTSSTVSNNEYWGVAVRGEAPGRGALTLTNSTISGNTGVGISIGNYNSYYAYPADAALVNCTVTGNSGGGLQVRGSLAAPSSAAIQNCILWSNGASAITLSGTDASAAGGRSLIQGGWPGANLDADPLFVDTVNGDHRLLPGSPCIDAGDNLMVPLGLWVDLGGKRRFIDDPLTPDTGHPGRLLPIVDLGAHEFGDNPPTKVRSR